MSAPSGTTWHPWVDSRGERAQVIGFERRAEPAADVTIAEADTEPVSWAVQRDDGQFSVQLPQTRGRYTLSVLKMTGRRSRHRRIVYGCGAMTAKPKAGKATLMLLDTYGLVYRAFFALPPLTTTKGMPINAAYGFTMMLTESSPTKNQPT